MIIVHYEDRPVAYATARDLELIPPVAALDRRDPRRRWATCLAFFARDVLAGRISGPYTDGRANHFARCALIPEQDFASLSGLSDLAAASWYGVPIEQIVERRRDLAISAHPHCHW